VQHRQAGREHRQRLGHRRRAGIVAGDMDHRAFGPRHQIGDQMRV
jgi:hypothetical protein